MGMHTDWSSEIAWGGIRQPVDAAHTLPAACYADQKFFEAEQATVFSSFWTGVAASDQVRDAGNTIVRSVAGQSIIITRDDDGELRAFRNACRHRGTELLEDDCQLSGTIRCPYHRWGYSLTGSLIATPRFDEYPLEGFDRADYGLHPVRVEAFAGVVFVSLEAEVPSVAECMGDLGLRLAGYELDTWRLREERSFEIRANWKLISENFQEYYHLTWVHPDLAKVSRVADHYRYQGPGMYCGQTTTPVSSDERDDWTAMPPAAGLTESDGASGRFVAMFPNVLLSVLPNHVFLMLLEPLAPGRTLERAIWLLPPHEAPVSEHAFAVTRDFWIDVNTEDIDIVQRNQRGLTAGGYTPGRYSPRFEEPVHRFANMLADRFTAQAPGDLRIPDGDPADDLDLFGNGVNPLPYRPA